MSLDQYFEEKWTGPDNANFWIDSYQLPKSGNFEGYPVLQCPYCLFSSYALNDFNMVNGRKEGFCPQCKNRVRKKTLEQCGRMSIEDYAQWVCQARQFDVNTRVKLGPNGPIRKWLSSHGVTSLFWEEYYKEKKRLDPTFVKTEYNGNRDNVSNTKQDKNQVC